MSHRLGITRWASRAIVAAAIGVFTLALPCEARAQSESGAAALTGIVLDPDAKAVVNAAVVVRNDSTGTSRATVTEANGRFTVADLTAGVWPRSRISAPTGCS